MFGVLAAMGSDLIERKEMSEEQNKAPNEGEARVLSDDELKGIVGGIVVRKQDIVIKKRELSKMGFPRMQGERF